VRVASRLGADARREVTRHSPGRHWDQTRAESVDELIDEGNAFEAGVVSGVEEAGNEDGREVHTREVPEDDVPGEYLDED
jgi:hypothetical protein